MAKFNKRGMRDRIDTYFSIYIRLRDSDIDGYGSCCTSGERIHWTEGDCGHFVPRGRYATRWDETNAHLQSYGDNRFRDGRQAEHGFFIDERYGDGHSRALFEKSRELFKQNKATFEPILEYYAQKAWEEADKRGIDISGKVPKKYRGD